MPRGPAGAGNAHEDVTSLELESGGLRCMIRPEAGGSLGGLWLDGVPVLRPAPPNMASARQSALFPLVPFSNRIADARLAWGGEHFALAPNFPPEPHAMHGIGWERPWRLEAADAARATLVLSHAGGAGWPFAFECRQRIALTPAALDLELEFVNRDRRAAPVGLGWHPYVVKRPGARLQFGALARWEMDARGLPTERVSAPGLDAVCDALDVNHVYEGFCGSARLRDDVFEVTVRSALPRLVASTQPAKDFVAIEPVTHATDAFNHGGRGTVTLAPGQTLLARMGIEVRPVHGAGG